MNHSERQERAMIMWRADMERQFHKIDTLTADLLQSNPTACDEKLRELAQTISQTRVKQDIWRIAARRLQIPEVVVADGTYSADASDSETVSESASLSQEDAPPAEISSDSSSFMDLDISRVVIPPTNKNAPA